MALSFIPKGCVRRSHRSAARIAHRLRAARRHHFRERACAEDPFGPSQVDGTLGLPPDHWPQTGLGCRGLEFADSGGSCGEAVRLPVTFPVKGHIAAYQLPAVSLGPIL